MSLVNKISKSLALTLMIIGFILTIGCEQDPISTGETAEIQQDVSSSPFTPIRYNSSGNFLNKIVTVSKLITWADGGDLKLDCKGDNGQVKVVLKVESQTISQDAELSISMDDEELSGYFDMVFSPHGITFSSPAILDINAKDLDLSGIDPDKVNIYYDNEDTGAWEVMNVQTIAVNISSGTIIIQGAELPHFSRYAIGLE